MRRILSALVLFILIVRPCFSQNYSYAWLNDIQIGPPESLSDINFIIRDINKRPEIKFVILTGNLTANGTDNQFGILKNALDSLTVPYYVIPGRSDLERSQSAGIAYLKFFKNQNFAFNYQGVEHIGLNTGLIWNHYGHVSVENLRWLDSVLNSIPKDREIILYSYFPVNSAIDDWYEITNRLSGKKIKDFIIGSPQPKNNIIEYSHIKSAVSISSRMVNSRWNYTLVKVSPDSLFFYSVDNNKTRLWGNIKKDTSYYVPVDSLQFKDLSGSFSKLKIKTRPTLLWKKDLNKTISSAVSNGSNLIYLTSNDGVIYCFNSGGNEVWKNSSGELTAGAPVNADSNLILGSLPGDLISFNDSTGSVIQSLGLNTPITSQLISIKGEFNGQTTTGIIFGTSKGDLYFYEAGTFELIWENHSASGMINTKPLLVNNRIIYGSNDGFLYCIDAGSGIINWKWRDRENQYPPSSCSPVSDGRNVYVVSPNSFVYAIDLMLGRTVWKKDYSSFESIGLSNNQKTILIKSVNDFFYKVWASDGKLEQKIKTDSGDDYLQNTPITYNKNILFCSQNGFIYFVDEKGNWAKLFFMGNSPMLNIIKLKENIFIASNKNGNVIAFKLD